MDSSSTQTPPFSPVAMSEADAAHYIGMSREFLRQSRYQGHRRTRTPAPPYVRIGRAIRYLRPDLDEWLASLRRVIR